MGGVAVGTVGTGEKSCRVHHDLCSFMILVPLQLAEEMVADADEIEAEETAAAATPAAVAPEDVPLSAEEQAVLKLLGDCTHAWNVLDKKTHALKLGRQALEKVKGATGIRPRMVAEVRGGNNEARCTGDAGGTGERAGCMVADLRGGTMRQVAGGEGGGRGGCEAGAAE